MSNMTPQQIRESSRKLSAADYSGTIRSYFPFWDSMYRPFLVRAVEALPADRFDWKPRPDMFTAREIVVHIAECERGWIHTTVDGGTYEEWVVPNRDPAQGWELAVPAPDHATMLSLLEEQHRHTQRWFEQPVSELSRVYVDKWPDRPERRFTLHWILDTLQQHEIHHRAQLIYYFRLMGLDVPASM
jgi:uncharacterized damage-inducible protein DinB